MTDCGLDEMTPAVSLELGLDEDGNTCMTSWRYLFGPVVCIRKIFFFSFNVKSTSIPPDCVQIIELMEWFSI